MSKICLILFLLLLFLPDVYGQSDFAVGFKFGASLSNISTEAQGRVDVGTKNRVGILAGVFLILLDNHVINIQSDLF